MPCAAAAALERRSEPASANEAVAHRVAAMTADAFILVWWWGYGKKKSGCDRSLYESLL